MTMIQDARQADERTHEAIRLYMPAIFKLLAFNYLILTMVLVLVNTVGVRLVISQLPIPLSTANALAFGLSILILLYGWRFLERRNQATALFVLYTRYSSQRRALKDTIENAENGVLDDEETLRSEVDLLEEAANNFLDAAEEQGLQPYLQQEQKAN